MEVSLSPIVQPFLSLAEEQTLDREGWPGDVQGEYLRLISLVYIHLNSTVSKSYYYLNRTFVSGA